MANSLYETNRQGIMVVVHHRGLGICFHGYNCHDSLQARLIEGIDQFRYIEIQHGSEAWRTQTKEIECLFISFACVLWASLSS